MSVMHRYCLLRFLLLVALAGSGCQSTLQGGLAEQEANELLLALSDKGIPAAKSSAGSGHDDWQVTVSQEEMADAVATLRAAGLPRKRHTGFGSVYKERGLVPGRFEERALYMSALQEEIAATLESVDGVISARVHVSLGRQPARRRLASSAQPVQEATASVLISYLPNQSAGHPIDSGAIQKLVANAVEGLKADGVVVIYSPARRVFSRSKPGSAGALGSHASRWFALAVAGLAMFGGLGLVGARKGWLKRHPSGDSA
jgi:type III secretion protein J